MVSREPRGTRATREQNIAKLRQAEVEFGKGKETAEVLRLIGVQQQTYYR